MSKKFDPQAHPERRPGEVFLGNYLIDPAALGIIRKGPNDFEKCVYRTKRLGKQIWTQKGLRDSLGMNPVFVQAAELEETPEGRRFLAELRFGKPEN